MLTGGALQHCKATRLHSPVELSKSIWDFLKQIFVDLNHLDGLALVSSAESSQRLSHTLSVTLWGEHSAGIWRPRRKADPSTTRLLYVLVNSDTPTVLCSADIISPTGRVTVCPPLVPRLSTIVYPSVSVISPLILFWEYARSFESERPVQPGSDSWFTGCRQLYRRFIRIGKMLELYVPVTSFHPCFLLFLWQTQDSNDSTEYDLKLTKII